MRNPEIGSNHWPLYVALTFVHVLSSTMSGSRRTGDLRRTRHTDEGDQPAPQSSYQNLALTQSIEDTQYSTTLQPYQDALPHYQSQSFAPVGPNETPYLPPAYDSGSYSTIPSNPYSEIISPAPQSSSRPAFYQPPILPSQPAMSGPGLRYGQIQQDERVEAY